MERPYSDILHEQAQRYPGMTAQDFVKLAYQSEFGPAHLSESGSAEALAYLKRELVAMEALGETDERCTPQHVERIGNKLARMPLHGLPEDGVPLLARLLVLTAREHSGTDEGFAARLDELRALPVAGLEEFLADYRGGAVHHSESYAALYHPHYRVLDKDYAVYFPALLSVERLMRAGKSVIVSIDGRCGSGKSTLGGLLEHVLGGNLYHMDDFYLPNDVRPADWESIPAGNMDLVRFREQVLEPARRGDTVLYRAYDGVNGVLRPAVPHTPRQLTVIEGSYSQHPSLKPFYDQTIFLTCERGIQNARLQRRERDSGYYDDFQRYWIPMEERYHDYFSIPEHADLLLDTAEFF